MPRFNRVELQINRSSHIVRTPRVMQLEGMFAVPPTKSSDVSWDIVLPLNEREWNIGLIVGPSGCGKSTLAREAFGNDLVSTFAWSADKTIVDDFPKAMSIKDVVALLSSVGFSSPPSWLRPFHVLSNGEQFRVTMARAMAESHSLFVVDEFTSVIDRTVAKIGSCAIAKTIRKRNQQFIAVSCHYDIIEWLQPDWVFDPATKSFQWRELRRRPSIDLSIQCVDKAAWQIFKKHHYLDTSIHKSAKCFVGMIDERPAAFASVLPFPHAVSPGWREHRTVCLPDFQGVGIGNAMSEFVGGLLRATGKPYRSATSHPAMIRYRAASRQWVMTAAPAIPNRQSASSTITGEFAGDRRQTASFRYVGPVLRDEARAFGIV